MAQFINHMGMAQMQFAARYLMELPYVLNIPDENYYFLYENTQLCITVNNNFYALYRDANLFPQTLLIGKKEELMPHQTSERGIFKCRTVLSLMSITDHSVLEEISEEEFINCIRSRIRKGDNFPSTEDAQKHLASLNREEIDAIELSEKIIKTARKIFPPTQSEECIDIINHFIKHYRVAFNDQFADDISLYQLGSGFTNGVLQEHYCDGVKISSAPIVGIIPPLMRNSWFNHQDILIEKFKTRLMTDNFDDQPELLLLRASNLLHKGALRSAVIEASAGIESFILRLLIKAFDRLGYDEGETKEILTKNWKFEDRCKKLFREHFGISVPEIAPLEWQKANKNRKELRDKIAHTSHEPSEKETKDFIESINQLVHKINVFFDSTLKPS